MATPKTTAVATLLFALLLALATTARAELPDPEKGFGNLKWGETIAGNEEFFKIKSKGNADFYIRNKDPYTLYGQKMERVIYGARGGKLFAAYVHMEDKDVFEKLENDLSAHYGPAKRSTSEGVNILQWKRGEFKIKLKEYPETGSLKLAFYFAPLSSDVNMANIDLVMDKIYSDEMEDYWVKGSPLLQKKD